MRLMRELQLSTGGAVDLHLLHGLYGRFVAKSPLATAPGPKKITYDKLFRFPRLWIGGVMGVSVSAFRKQFIT